MKLGSLEQQKADDFYYLIKYICCSKDIENIGQRMFTLHKIYDYGKLSGLDVDNVHVARHINGTGAIKASNSNLVQVEPVYAIITDSDNSASNDSNSNYSICFNMDLIF